MGFYENIRDSYAGRLIKQYGAPMTLRKRDNGTYDPATGAVTNEPAQADFPCYGVMQFIDSRSANQFYSTGTMKETMIEKDDRMVLLSATGLSVLPEALKDSIVIDSHEYRIIRVIPLQPGGVVISYNMQVRR